MLSRGIGDFCIILCIVNSIITRNDAGTTIFGKLVILVGAELSNPEYGDT